MELLLLNSLDAPFAMEKDLAKYLQVKQLRDQGQTYTQIADAIGVSRTRAQQMALKANELMKQETLWTNGLPARVVGIFKRLYIKDRHEAYNAFQSGAIQQAIKQERGIGSATLNAIALWLELPGFEVETSKKMAIEHAIKLLQSNGYIVKKNPSGLLK